MIEGTRPRFGTACVLAGGRGRRMEGRDKLFIEFSGERLLGRIGRQLRGRFADIVAVSSRPSAFDGLGFRVVADSFPDAGPVAGLHAGLRTALSEWVYVVACDMPYFSASWCDELVGRIDEAEAAGIQPLCAAARSGPFFEPFHAFYRRPLALAIDDAIAGGQRPSIQSVARSRPMALADFDGAAHGSPGLFVNVNTPDELAAADSRHGI